VFLANELRAIKRREDLLARWNEEVFVLASYFPKGESVEAFGRRVLGALQASRFPHADKVGPLRFTVSGAWGPSRDYVMAKDALEATVFQALAGSPGAG
jgi:GGDEF domain-containing protein